MASSRTMTATTGTNTLVLKLTVNLVRSFSIVSRLRQIRHSKCEVGFHFALIAHGDFFDLAGEPFVPGLELISACRHIRDGISAVVSHSGEVLILQNQHDTTDAS